MGKKGKKKTKGIPPAAVSTVPQPEPEPGVPKMSRAERRAKEREAEKSAKKAARVKTAPMSAAAQKGRTEVAKSLWSTATEGEHVSRLTARRPGLITRSIFVQPDENASVWCKQDNGILNPATTEFRRRVDEFLANRTPTLEQVCELDQYMKRLQQTLAAEGQKANKNWLICSANLSHAVEARKIFVFSQRAEEAKQRVLRFNSDVKVFNECRDKVYSSPAHKQALDYMSKESVTMADGSVQLRSTMEKDASMADFEQLAMEMKMTGGARAGQIQDTAPKKKKQQQLSQKALNEEEELSSSDEDEEDDDDDDGFARLLAEMKADANGLGGTTAAHVRG